jgi:hypothetical protein
MLIGVLAGLGLEFLSLGSRRFGRADKAAQKGADTPLGLWPLPAIIEPAM